MTFVFFCLGKAQCEYCFKVFYNKATMNRHVKTQHGNVETAVCEICNTTFRNEGVMRDHMRRQHNIYQSVLN